MSSPAIEGRGSVSESGGAGGSGGEAVASGLSLAVHRNNLRMGLTREIREGQRHLREENFMLEDILSEQHHMITASDLAEVLRGGGGGKGGDGAANNSNNNGNDGTSNQQGVRSSAILASRKPVQRLLVRQRGLERARLTLNDSALSQNATNNYNDSNGMNHSSIYNGGGRNISGTFSTIVGNNTTRTAAANNSASSDFLMTGPNNSSIRAYTSTPYTKANNTVSAVYGDVVASHNVGRRGNNNSLSSPPISTKGYGLSGEECGLGLGGVGGGNGLGVGGGGSFDHYNTHNFSAALPREQRTKQAMFLVDSGRNAPELAVVRARGGGVGVVGGGTSINRIGGEGGASPMRSSSALDGNSGASATTSTTMPIRPRSAVLFPDVREGRPPSTTASAHLRGVPNRLEATDPNYYAPLGSEGEGGRRPSLITSLNALSPHNTSRLRENNNNNDSTIASANEKRSGSSVGKLGGSYGSRGVVMVPVEGAPKHYTLSPQKETMAANNNNSTAPTQANSGGINGRQQKKMSLPSAAHTLRVNFKELLLEQDEMMRKASLKNEAYEELLANALKFQDLQVNFGV